MKTPARIVITMLTATSLLTAAAGTAQAADPISEATVTAGIIAAAAPDSIPVTEVLSVGDGYVAQDPGGVVEVPNDPNDAVEFQTPGTQETIQLSLPELTGAQTAKRSDDGTITYPTAQDTTVAVQPLAGGVRVLTVIESSESPTAFDYKIDLPDGATLAENTDESISVFARTETEVPLPGEDARINAAVTSILGENSLSLDSLDKLTDKQIDQLAAIPEAETTTVTKTEKVAEIAAPWATDANGNPVPTRYELNDGTLTQIIEPSAEAEYPIVADPSWWWWTATTAACIGQLASFTVVGAKVVRAFAKADKVIKGSTRLIRAYNKLGARWETVIDKIKKYVKSRKNLTKDQIDAVGDLIGGGGKLLGEILGIGSCVAIVLEVAR